MERCWYLLINGKREGPYTLEQLKKHPNLTPLTLVWKKGFVKWVPLGSVQELSFLVKKEQKHSNIKKPQFPGGTKDVGVLTEPSHFHPNPSHWLLFILFIIVVFFLLRLWLNR